MKIKDELTNILSIILDIFEISDANDITIADILSKSRKETYVIIRCLFINKAIKEGYKINMIARFLNRTPSTIRHLINISKDYYDTSKIYRDSEQQINKILINKEQNTNI